jgi:hypothetical protein
VPAFAAAQNQPDRHMIACFSMQAVWFVLLVEWRNKHFAGLRLLPW